MACCCCLSVHPSFGLCSHLILFDLFFAAPALNRAAHSPSPTIDSLIGNHTLYCNGGAVVGPDVRTLALTVFVIAVPSTLFFAVIVPTFGHRLAAVVLAVVPMLVVIALAYLARAAGTDPGIVLRNPYGEGTISRVE